MLAARAASRPTPPLLEFGLHAASHCALFDEQAGADAADFVCCVADSSRGSGLCSTAGHHRRKLLTCSLLHSPLDSSKFFPGFLQRARLALDSGFALAERLVLELVKEVIPLLSLFLRDLVLVVDSRVLNRVSCCVPADAEEIAFMRCLFAPSHAHIDKVEEVPISCDAVQGHVTQQPELADFEPMIETTSAFSSDCLFLLLEQANKCES